MSIYVYVNISGIQGEKGVKGDPGVGLPGPPGPPGKSYGKPFVGAEWFDENSDPKFDKIKVCNYSWINNILLHVINS